MLKSWVPSDAYSLSLEGWDQALAHYFMVGRARWDLTTIWGCFDITILGGQSLAYIKRKVGLGPGDDILGFYFANEILPTFP